MADKTRTSLLTSRLSTFCFQLLPNCENTPVQIEKGLIWQSAASKDFPIYPEFHIINPNGLQTEATDIYESLTIQSYSYWQFLDTIAQVEDHDPIRPRYYVLTTPGTILHPSTLYIIAKAIVSQYRNGDIVDFFYGNFGSISTNTLTTYYRTSAPDIYSVLARSIAGPLLVVNQDILHKLQKNHDWVHLSPYAKIWSTTLNILSENLHGKHIPLCLSYSPQDANIITTKDRELLKPLMHSYANKIKLPLNSIDFSESTGTPIAIPTLKSVRGSVQIVIPYRNNSQLTIQCLKSLLSQSCLTDLNVTLVDNGSEPVQTEQVRIFLENHKQLRGEIITDDGYFNYARINNFGASNGICHEAHSNARSSNTQSGVSNFILFLNNDVEISTPNTISELRSLAAQQDVGVAGGCLKYNNHAIQSAGINFAAVRPMNVNSEDYYAHIFREVNAISFAMAMVRRNVYEELGGLDTFNCPNGFGDCLFGHTLKAHGYRALYTPQATAYHHESLSRGRIPEELELLEMSQLGLTIASVWDDLNSEKQPCRIQLQTSNGSNSLPLLVEKLRYHPRLWRICNSLTTIILRVWKVTAHLKSRIES